MPRNVGDVGVGGGRSFVVVYNERDECQFPFNLCGAWCEMAEEAEDFPSTEQGSPVSSFDVELLIDCVKSRRIIWDPSDVNYKNRNKKKEEWSAICRMFYADFDEKPDVAKNKICKELQIKWKSIRDAYQRQLKSQKTKSGDAAKTKKQYLYARQMEFLKSTPSHNRTEDSTAIDSPQADVTDDNEETLSGPQQQTLSGPQQQTPSTSTIFRRNKKNLEENLQKYMTVMTKQSEETLSQQKDDDYHFLLSILPTMKQISDDDKLKLRCDIIQLIMKYKEQSKRDLPTLPPFNISPQTGLFHNISEPSFPNIPLHPQHPLTGLQNFPMTHQSPSPSYPSTDMNPTIAQTLLKTTTSYSSTIADQHNQGNPIQVPFSPTPPAEISTGSHAGYGSEQSEVLTTQLPSFKTKAKNKRLKVNVESTASVTSGALAAQEQTRLATDISRGSFSPTTEYHAGYGSEQSDVLQTQDPSFNTKAKNKRQKVNLESTATVTSGALADEEQNTLAKDISRGIFSPSPESQLSGNSNESLLSL